MKKEFGPIPGDVIFHALEGRKAIIMAANTRIVPGVVRGILRAAKDTDSAIVLELAKSESDLKGGYTGLTPRDYARRTMEVASEVEHDVWALHADHLTVKRGETDEVVQTKALIEAQIEAGYTSFAIDASYLYNPKGANLLDEMAENIDVTAELARFIEDKTGGQQFGLEVEVGEIGKVDGHGRVLTTPEEAVSFIRALNEKEVYPQLLAIANGSTHGNVYDEQGTLIPQVSIDIPRTREVAQALRENGLRVGIAQHGITGTPRELIKTQFPKGDILKGNVGTFWQNVFWDVLKVDEADLYHEIRSWTLDSFSQKAPGKTDEEVFGTYSKFSIKEFFEEIYSIGEETERSVEERTYVEASAFLDAFESKGTAAIVRSLSG